MRCPQCASRQTIAILLRKLSSAAPCGHRLRCRYQNSGGGYSVASYILSSLREERLGEKGGAFFNGKEGRDDFRTTFLKGKEGRVGFRKKLFFHNHFKCLEDKLDVIPEAGILYILQIELDFLLHDYMDVIILRISSLHH